MNVLVVGGAGFIGRSVVAALVERGHAVVIGTRRTRRLRQYDAKIVACDVEAIELHSLTQMSDWTHRISPFDVIINCAGILRERWGETFDAVYHRAPVAMAGACAAVGKRFIHVTALGLTAGASSGFITAKLAGEHGIGQIGGETCIVRPSLLDGLDGFGSRWVRRVAQWPVHFVPIDAVGRLAPLHVHDLGEAIAALCVCPQDALPKSVELGGETNYGMAQYLHIMRHSRRVPVTLRVPRWMVRACAHALDVLHLTPLSWGHVELMRRDNVPRDEDAFALRKWIGRAPAHIGAYAGNNAAAVSALSQPLAGRLSS